MGRELIPRHVDVEFGVKKSFDDDILNKWGDRQENKTKRGVVYDQRREKKRKREGEEKIMIDGKSGYIKSNQKRRGDR